jgi:uncharacterized protein (UPF0333 family)
MANRELQGWSADPFQLHEERYFSAGRPTKLVRDGKVESYEDPPSDTYEAPEDEAEAERFVPVPAAAPGGYLAGGYPPGRYPAGGYAAGGYAGAAPPRAGVDGQYAYGPAAQQVRAQAVRRRSRAFLVVAATAIMAATVAGMVVLVKQESHSTPNPNRPTAISQAAFVRQSAAKTLAERTANLTLSGTVQSLGHAVTVNGTGAINFNTNEIEVNLSAGSPGQLLTEQEILVNGNLYLTLTISGTSLAKLTGGRAWILLPVAQSGSANQVGSDPLSSLSLLEQQGIDVRPIGTKIIEGQSCTGYAITPTKAAMLASTRAEFTKLGFAPAQIDQEVSLAQEMLPPTVTVWIDAQGLMREMSMNLGLQTSGSSSTVSGSMVIYLSYLGSPVQITAPAASDVISYTSFLKSLGAKT